MHARSFRRQVLLSTTMFVGALAGYTGRAYAACTPIGCGIIALLAIWLGIAPAQAQNATWELNPSTAGPVAGTFDFNAANNWDPDTVPTSTAFFDQSNGPDLSFSADTTIGGWTFNAGAADYEFTIVGRSITFNGAGISINGGSATITNEFGLFFNGSSTAGSATITNNEILQFFNTSTAGGATIANNEVMQFVNASSAASATITNDDEIDFIDTSTAGSATITNNRNSFFRETSTAGSATITNENSLQFFDTSTAGSATIINNDLVRFLQNSTGGQAQFINNNAAAIVDFSSSAGPAGTGLLTAGSLAGPGNYFLGGNELTVGGNNLSTEVSGVISDCGLTGTECTISGATGGSLVKAGTGSFILSGANTYTGPTTVQQGALAVNGSIVNSSTTVDNGATLMGTGTLGATTILGGGIYAPGSSIGTQTVNGAFTLHSGAIFEVEVNAAGQSDRVVVNGTVNLTGSILRVLAEDGNYAPSTSYLIVDNDGTDAVVGTFASVTTNLAFLTPSVVYNGGTGNDVVLTLQRTVVPSDGDDGDDGGNGFVSFCSVAETRNQCNVALALDQFPTDNPLFLAILLQTVEGARQAFDALSGEIHATLPGVLADESRYVREAVLGRLMQASYTKDNGQVASLGAGGPQVASLNSQAMALGYDDKSLGAPPPSYGPGLAFWTRAYGAWGDFDGNKNAATADRDLGGFVSGMDARVSGSWRLGLATGASFSDVSVADRHSAADVGSFHLVGYTGGMAGPLALRGGGAWAWNDIDTSRAVSFPGFFEREKASYDADTRQIFGEVAYPMAMGRIALESFAGLAYVQVETDSFKEHGELAALRGADNDQNVGYSTLGLRAASTMHWNSMIITPHVSAAWQHAFDDLTPGAALAFASTGIGFGITGVPLAEDSLLVEAGLDFNLGPNATAGVSYSGQIASDLQDNAVKGRFTWLF